MLVCFSVLFFDTFQIEVSAEDSGGSGRVSVPVELTSAQTLALYGQNINALYFNGSTTQYVSFDYWKSSKELVYELENVFSGSPEAYPFISAYNNQNIFGLSYSYWNNSSQGQSYPEWFSSSNGSVSQKQDFSVFEFLIYRWEGLPNTISERQYDFQFSFDQSLDLEGVDRFRSFYGFSIGTVYSLISRVNVSYSNLHSQTNLYVSSDSSTPLYTGTETRIQGSAYFGNAFMPVVFTGNDWISGSGTPTPSTMDTWLCPAPHMALCPIDTGMLESSVTISRSVLNVRAAQAVRVNDGDLDSSELTTPYVYLIIACPIVWGDITPPEPPAPDITDQLDRIGSDVNNINVGIGDININLSSTNHRLDLILDLLDDIYNKEIAPSLDVDLTQQGPLSWVGTKIDNAASSIVSGIRGLFVPTQTDLINFRLNLQSDFQNHFPAFFTADDKIRNLYSIFSNSVNPRSFITVPLVEMSIPDYANNTSADFSFGGFDVELKPKQDKLGILYDSLALIIDFVVTLGLLNMLKKKLFKFLEGGATD